MDQKEWIENFLAKRGRTRPDKRPIYAYHCSEKEYQTARKLVLQMLPKVLHGYDYRRFQEIFCLFAAQSLGGH